ncbi:MAG: ABC transporter permease [Thermoanaerobaculia bacterium]
MISLSQDLRQALRSLRRSPGFTAVVVFTLALTLGATTITFALLDAVVFEPLPFAEPQRLVALWNAQPERDIVKDRVRALDFLAWREQSDAFDRLALFSFDTKTLTGAGDPVQLFGSQVTEDFFPLLGVRALHGRALTAEDYAPGAPPAVVLSHALWSRHFGADPVAIGRSLSLDGDSYTVVGVLPRQIMPLVAWHLGRLELGSSQAHYWLTNDAEARHQTSGVHGVLGRLASGVSVDAARARMDALSRRLEADSPQTHEGLRVTLVPLLEEAVGDITKPLWLLLGAVGLTLLVACANVANLLLVRADSRTTELALRTALGAGRLRIWRHLAAEVAILAIAGAALGSLFAVWGLRLLPRVSPAAIPRLDESGFDPRAAAVTFGLCLVCALLCSWVPAFQAGRLDLDAVLRTGGRRGYGSGNAALRQGLVFAEMALAVVLVVGSGLLLRSFGRLQAVDPGFQRGSILTFKILPHADVYPEIHRLTGFYDDFLRELRSIPGVSAAAAAYDHPLDSNWTQSFRVTTGPEPDVWQSDAFRTVTPEFFATLGVEITAGRGFTAGDDAGAAGAVIVNETFSRRYFPDREALGQELEMTTTQWRWGDDAIPSAFKVVGVVEDVRFKGLAEAPEPAFYLPYRQTPHYEMSIVVRTERDPLALVPEIRSRLRALDPGMPIAKVATLDQLLSAQVAKPRFSAFALGGFAVAAVLLAIVGMWGVLSYAVRRRTHEIGIRMALGAAGRDVFRWAVWHGLRPAVLGLAAGILGALALSRVLRGVLYEISPTDPATFFSVPVLLLAAAFAACALPAVRAARTEPMRVLRDG